MKPLDSSDGLGAKGCSCQLLPCLSNYCRCFKVQSYCKAGYCYCQICKNKESNKAEVEKNRARLLARSSSALPLRHCGCIVFPKCGVTSRCSCVAARTHCEERCSCGKACENRPRDKDPEVKLGGVVSHKSSNWHHQDGFVHKETMQASPTTKDAADSIDLELRL